MPTAPRALASAGRIDQQQPHGGAAGATVAPRALGPATPGRITSPRVVPLRGVSNFRDLGGYPTADGGRTRHGVIYRSAGLSDLADPDRAVLAGLRLAAVIDLRATFELALAPTGDLWPSRTGRPPTVLHVPVLDGEDAAGYARSVLIGSRGHLGDYYRLLLDRGGDGFARAFNAVATLLPSLHFCSTGKDRTGLLSALLLAAVGVPPSAIARDWARSLPLLRPRPLAPAHDTAPIQHALAHLQRWGGARGYLSAHGVPSATFEALHARFVGRRPREGVLSGRRGTERVG
jgi:protein-tyrosine phosphatase